MSVDSRRELDYTYDRDNTFWTKYERGRPVVPESFFEKIFDHHRRKGGRFETVHDAAAGPAIHTARIAKPFSKVLVSDVSEQNVAASKLRLQNLDKDVAFRVERLENAAWIEAESVDLVFAGTCMHFGDYDASMQAFVRQLKPGGTLAIACTGFAFFQDARIMQLWAEMFQKAFDSFAIQPLLQAGVQENKETLPFKGFTCAANVYDPIALPTSVFDEGAVRHKVNMLDDWWYRSHVPHGREALLPKYSRIGPTEEILEYDEQGWGFEATLERMRDMSDSIPVFGDYSQYQHYWARFEEIVGSGTAKGWWPHLLILATKK